MSSWREGAEEDACYEMELGWALVNNGKDWVFQFSDEWGLLAAKAIHRRRRLVWKLARLWRVVERVANMQLRKLV